MIFSYNYIRLAVLMSPWIFCIRGDERGWTQLDSGGVRFSVRVVLFYLNSVKLGDKQKEHGRSVKITGEKMRGKAFSLICDSCLSTLGKIILAQFFNIKLSPGVELDEFNSNRWFNFWHNLLIRIRRKCEGKKWVTPPHAFMQQIKYYGITSWRVCRKLPEVKTEYLSELKLDLRSICYCLIRVLGGP